MSTKKNTLNQEIKEEIKVYEDEYIKEITRSNKKIEEHLNNLTKNSRKEIFIDIINYYRILVEKSILYIYVKSGEEKKQKITVSELRGNAKKYIKKTQYKFLDEAFSELSENPIHNIPSDDNSERIFFYHLQNITDLKVILEKNYKIQILQNLTKIEEYIISNTSKYYLKIKEKIDNPSYGILKEAEVFIKKIKPFFWNHKNEMYYEISFWPLENLNSKYHNKSDLIIAYTKINLKKGTTSKIKYKKIKIQLEHREIELYIITDWKISIQKNEVENFMKSVTKKEIFTNPLELNSINLYLSENKLNLLELVNLNDFNKLKSEINSKEETPFLDFLEDLKNKLKKNIEGSRVVRYLLCNFNKKSISSYMNEGFDKNITIGKYNGFDIKHKSKPFDNFPLTLNLPDTWTVNKDLKYILDEDEDYTADKFVAEIKKYSENNNIIFFDYKNTDYTFEEIKKLIQKYNEKLNKKGYHTYKDEEQIKFFDDKWLFINSYADYYIKIKNKINNFLNSSINEHYEPQAKQWLESNTEINFDKKQKHILNNIFKNSAIGVIYGSPGTGKTLILKYINRILKNDKKLILSLTNNSVNNLKIQIENDAGKNHFLTIHKFAKTEDNNYDILIVDECSMISNKDFYGILSKAKFKKLILVGDEKQIAPIRFGNWFNLILNDTHFEKITYELTNIKRTESDRLQNLWQETRRLANPDCDSSGYKKIYALLVKYEILATLEDLFLEEWIDTADQVILTWNYEGLFGINNINNYFQEKNTNEIYEFGFKKFKKGDPVLFSNVKNHSKIPKNTKGKILNIFYERDFIVFDIEINFIYLPDNGNNFENEIKILESHNYSTEKVVIRFNQQWEKNENCNFIFPFELSYAITIHKTQGLEYESVKIILPDILKKQIEFNVFYTAITRAKKELKIYCPANSDYKILSNLKFYEYQSDLEILSKYEETKSKL
ncbi:DUF2075 domain-containing protein [Mycoplasma hyorhinis]|uniref:ATP-dependent DNA helicase n=1 Tax=Mesomycoplasma hyorhinis TaxID=2100 RepID=UPI0013722D8F|nr:AAA family ATPase [Mesomycoplasma hyorhinis]MXR38984.1 DUF2075 domain-containing protein [Mesomycoplasma hyorhinis]